MAETTSEATTTFPVMYSIQDSEIARMRSEMGGLTADTREGYEEVRKSIATCRTTRTAIEKKRVELKADALEYGRAVDREARRLTGMIEEIEEPLKAEKARIDDAAERERRAKHEAERLAKEAEARAALAAEEARLADVRRAEEERPGVRTCPAHAQTAGLYQ